MNKRVLAAVIGSVLLLPPTVSAAPLVPLSGTDTIVWVSVDDASSGPIGLGFTFSFFGTDQTDVFINSNGNLTFGSGNSSFINGAFPTGSTAPMIAPYWNDLQLPPGDVRYSTDTGVFAATWNGVGFFGEGGTVTAQAALFGAGNSYGFAPGSIVFSYGTVTNSSQFWGAGATVGINSGNGTTFAILGGGVFGDAEAIGLSGTQWLFAPQNEREYSVQQLDAAVPEPTSLLLLGTGLVGLARARARRKAR